MADRESKLRLLVELVGADKAAKVVQLLGDSFGQVETDATGAASALQTTAAAVDQVAAAESEATDESRKTAAALETVGAAAVETGQEIVSTAESGAGALREVAATAQAEALALEEAGRAGVDSGRDVEAGAARATAAEEDIATAARRVRTELETTGDTGRLSAQEIATAFIAAAGGIRDSGTAAEVQRVAMQTLISEAEKLTREYIEAGAEGKESANITGTALIELRARLADINTEISEQIGKLRTTGGEGAAAFGEIKGAALNFQTIAAGATARVNESWEQLNETFRITPRQLNNTVQAVTLLGIEIQEMSTRGETATLEQIALYKRLETQITKLTARANQLSNAAKDNAVRLKETGNQIQGVALGVQQLTTALGPNAAKIGLLVGNVGQLGGAYEQMKDSLGLLNLNQVGAARGALGLGLQLTAIIGTAIAATAAGLKLASVNKENAEAMKDAASAAKDLIPTQEGLRDGWDGVQHALQGVLVDIDQFVRISSGMTDSSAELTDKTRELMDVTVGYEKRVIDLASSLDQLGVAVRSGRSGTDLYAVALRDGLNETEAFKLGVQDAAEVLQFYRDAIAAGAPGQALWNQAMRESGGTAAGVTASVRELIPAMHELLGVQGKLPPALQKEFDARQKLVIQLEASRRAYDAEGAAKQSASDATQANVRTMIEENTVTEGSSQAINRRTAAIAEHILQSDVWSVSLGRTASALQETLNQTDGLTAAERARIQELIALTERANELTAAEQAYAKQLAESIQNGNKAIAMTAALGAAKDALAAQTRALTESERMERESAEVHAQSITDRIELIRELITAEEYRLGIGEKQRTDNFLAGASIDFLRQKEAQLIREKEEGLTIVRSATAAKAEESTAREELSAIIEREKAAAVGATSAHADLHAVLENGRTVYTNLSDAQRTNAGAGIKVAESQKEIRAKADEATIALQKLGGDVVPLVTTSFDALIAKGADVEAMFERVNTKIREMDKAAKEAAAE